MIMLLSQTTVLLYQFDLLFGFDCICIVGRRNYFTDHPYTGFVRLRENLENLEKGTFLKKIRENLENSGNFLTIFTTSGKTLGILFCQISLPSSLGHLATNQTNVLLTGTLTNPVTAF